MRVLHAFKDYYPPTPGGVELYIHEVVHSLKGFQFAVLTSSRSKKRVVDHDEGVRVIRSAEKMRPASTPVTPEWKRFFSEAGADLLHFHMPHPYGELAFLRSKATYPMIAHYHADIVGRGMAFKFFKPFQQKFLSRASRIIVGSPRLIETSEALQPHRERAVVIPYGVDPAEWAERPEEADELRQRFPGPLVVFLGRLAYYKGIDVLIEAMRTVDATCLIVGDGPKRKEIEDQIATLHLRHKVVLVGAVEGSRRQTYLHAADVFVLPATSRAESFGIAMLQAMACGTPAISTEVGTGTSWVNQHESTGLVVEPGDKTALAVALKTILFDRDKREAMGVAAMDRVRDHFTKFNMLESLATLYSSL
ncbi:MAG TPA: glycosyltransferase [Actinomycetota bacterium]|nr:glycosyltransferase [Actinomycetota bacterium]